MEILALATLVALILTIAASIYFSLRRKKTLTEKQKQQYQAKISRLDDMSAREAIIESDKLLSHILRDFGYSGTVAEQLKRKPSMLANIDETWRLHKLRNKIVHDLQEPLIHPQDLKTYVQILEKLIQ